MDIADNISKIASRKRMGEDVEKLREKVSRETAKVIKLKVAQDTAYWDLKEKLQGVEANHERLQANMVDVQMQHEAISSAYHRELRQRPETLNKLASTREIADVLEEHTERVRAALRRTQADIDRVRGAYDEAGARAAQAAAAAHSAVRAHRAALQDTVARQHAAAQDQVERVAREVTHRGELLAAVQAQTQQLRDKLQIGEREVEEGRARVAVLQRDLDELRCREEDGRRVHGELEMHIEQLTGEKEALRTQLEQNAVKERESLAALCEEMSARDERSTAELEAERERGRAAAAQAHAEAEELRANLTRAEAALRNETEARVQLETALQEKITMEEKLKVALEEEKTALAEKSVDLARTEIAWEEKSSAHAKLEAEFAELRKRAEEMSKQHEEELSRRASTVAALMRDVAAEGGARARAETTIKARDAALKDKEVELARQNDIILELRADKERLQEKIGDMQTTIDNIQKELSGPRKVSVLEPAVRDTSTNKPAVRDTNANKPAVRDTNTNKPAIRDTNTNTPAVRDTNTNKPAVLDTNTNKPAIRDTNTNKPLVRDTNTNKPAVRNTNTNKPAVRDTNTNTPAVRDTNTTDKPPSSAQDLDTMLYTFLSDSSVDTDHESEVLRRRLEVLRSMKRIRQPKPRGIGSASRVRPLPVVDEREPRASTPTPASAPRFFKNK